jgi:hypothetical protein
MKTLRNAGFIAFVQLLAINNAVQAQLSIPESVDTNRNPVEKFTAFLTLVFDGLVVTGVGVAGCAIAYIIVTAIAGGRPNVRWAAVAVGGGVFLTSIGYVLDQIFGAA